MIFLIYDDDDDFLAKGCWREEKISSFIVDSPSSYYILASTTTTLFFWSPAPIYYYYFLIIIINYIYIVTCSSSKPCRRPLRRTDAYANKDFPQLPPTCLGAKLVGTSLVPRYLAVAVRVHGFSWSYSPFRCWSFEFPAVIWHLAKKHVLESLSTFLVPLPKNVDEIQS